MKKRIAATALLAAFLSMASSARAYIETFGSDNDGFTTYTIDAPGYPSYVMGTASSFSPTGGNPGGYLYGNVTAGPYDRLYAFELAGSATGSLTGQTLSVDYRSTGTITGPANAVVSFYITDAGCTNYFFSSPWNANTNGSWITESVLIDGGGTGFTPGPNNSGALTFAQIAANPGWVGLIFSNGDFSSDSNLGFTSANGATISIDNFGTPGPAAPMPPAFLLFGPCIAALAVIRRKWKHH